MLKLPLKPNWIIFFSLFCFGLHSVYGLSPSSPLKSDFSRLPPKSVQTLLNRIHNTQVLVVGYGVVGHNVAAALRREGYSVFVYDSVPGIRAQAFRHGFPTVANLALYLQPWKEDERKDSPLIIADCTPPGTGAKNNKAIYSTYRGITGVVFQGGENVEIADLNYSPELTGFPHKKVLRTIRVQPCSITAMIQIFTPILQYYSDQPVKIFLRAIRDTNWKEAFEPYSPYHHGDTFCKQLKLYAPTLLRNLDIETVAKTDLDYLYHWNYAEVKAKGITAKKVVAWLKPHPRLAVVEPLAGIFDPADMMILHPENGSRVTTVQVVPAGVDKVGIYYAVPHTTNVIPPTLDAIHLLLGDAQSKEAQRWVDGNERILRAKFLTEMAFHGRNFGRKKWLDKYQSARDKREKLRIIKICTIGGSRLIPLLTEFTILEKDPELLDYMRRCFSNFTVEEMRAATAALGGHDQESVFAAAI